MQEGSRLIGQVVTDGMRHDPGTGWLEGVEEIVKAQGHSRL